MSSFLLVSSFLLGRYLAVPSLLAVAGAGFVAAATMSWVYLVLAVPMAVLTVAVVWLMRRLATPLRFGVAVGLHSALAAAPREVTLHTGDAFLHVRHEWVTGTWYVARVSDGAIRDAMSDLDTGQSVTAIPVQLYMLDFGRWFSVDTKHQKITGVPDDGVLHFNFGYGTTLPAMRLSVRTGATKADPRDAVRLAEELRRAKPDTD